MKKTVTHCPVEYVEYLNSQVSPLTRIIEQQSGHHHQPFVPDPNDELKTPEDEKWWEFTHARGDRESEGKEIGGMNPSCAQEWEGGHQQQEQQEHEETAGRVAKQDIAKGGALLRKATPPNIRTGTYISTP